MEDNTPDLQGKTPPNNWLIESILVTIFCCWPLGIVGIINAAKVESKFYQGDIAGAEKASKEAKKWTLISFVTAIILATLYIIGIAIFGVFGATNGDFNF